MPNKAIGIVGSRRRDRLVDYEAVLKAFDAVYVKGDTIVSGGCPHGGDRFAEIIAKTHDIPIQIFRPDWNRYSRGAGMIRNGQIALAADMLIACVAEDRTGGTEDAIKKFRKAHPKGTVLLV